MSQPILLITQRLNKAWQKFSDRVDAVRMKTKTLLIAIDEQKREREIAKLRKGIQQ